MPCSHKEKVVRLFFPFSSLEKKRERRRTERKLHWQRIHFLMNQSGKTAKGGWLLRFGWAKSKRKVRNGDVENKDIPTQVALGKVSRSVIDDDLTLESGDVFTHGKSSESDEHLDLLAPPCRLRQIDETRADSTCERQAVELTTDRNERAPPTNSCPGRTKTEPQNETTSRNVKAASEKKVQKSTAPIIAAADATTIALSVWVCW
jgi:hypothetical protein